jgi:iron complex transport system ATP-binding protein
MLETENLCAGYGGFDIIRDIHLTARRGELLAIVGPNGCGKTTLLKTIARLLPCRGTIRLDGEDILSLAPKNLAKKIALMGQSGGIYFPYSVYDTAALGRYPYMEGFFKGLGREDREVIAGVLKRLELWEEKDRLISELSGGQLQRVFLARTLVQNPELILLDEPTNHLDLKHQVELLDYLSAWAAEQNRAVVAVLHDLNLARHYASQAALMKKGVLVSSGPSERVLSGAALKDAYGIDIRAFMLASLDKWRDEPAVV